MTRWDFKHLVRTINSQRRSHSILLQIPYWQKTIATKPSGLLFSMQYLYKQGTDNQIVNSQMIIRELSG